MTKEEELDWIMQELKSIKKVTNDLEERAKKLMERVFDLTMELKCGDKGEHDEG